MFHGQVLVINGTTVIGEKCIFRNGIKVGSKILDDGNVTKAATFGNNVEMGSNSVNIRNKTIGNNVVTGAGSDVVKDIPDKAIFGGNPARIISYKN